MEFDPATLHSYVSLLVFNCSILQENGRKVTLSFMRYTIAICLKSRNNVKKTLITTFLSMKD
ncbi:hypothetical protein E1H99_08445 [Enterococcus hirae]|nr:hypothetical protein E1H99_08445 [Enterococcus hirae]